MTAEDKIKLKAKERELMDKIEQLQDCAERNQATFAEIRKHNESQDASMQEIAANQQKTHMDMVVTKEKMSNIEKTLDKLDNEIHNGFADKIMSRAYDHTAKLTNELIEIVKQKNLQSFKLLALILGAGGIVGIIIKLLI